MSLYTLGAYFRLYPICLRKAELKTQPWEKYEMLLCIYYWMKSSIGTNNIERGEWNEYQYISNMWMAFISNRE